MYVVYPTTERVESVGSFAIVLVAGVMMLVLCSSFVFVLTTWIQNGFRFSKGKQTPPTQSTRFPFFFFFF